MPKKTTDSFDYENAELDILDAGGDPDYMDYNDPVKRDRYMRSMGMDPKKYGSTVNERGRKTNGTQSDDCFVTTACIRSRGLPDDCEELTVLRRFRDTYLMEKEEGQEDIRTYYELAPMIVRRIDAMENAGEIWDRVYREMIAPCVRMIRRNDPEGAYSLYKNYTLRLYRTI